MASTRIDSERPTADGEGRLLAPLDRARIRHERLIAMLAFGAGVIGVGTVAWRIATVEAWAGWRIMVVAIFGSTVFLGRLWYWDHLVWWKPWARTTFEVTICSVVILLDALVGPEFLVTSSTGYLQVLAVTVCSLRLRPALSLYAAGLAITQQAAIYLWGLQSLPEGPIPAARHYQEMGFRLAVLALIGAVGVQLAHTLAREIAAAANEERVRAAFGSYVDSRVVRRVLRGDLRLEPERRVITVLFVDIRGFTAMTESTEPIEVFRRLNIALDAMATEVQAQGGIVNKFLGDGLLALFGAPEPQPDHARRAVRTALRILERVAVLSRDGRFPNLKVGVGIATGEAIVGDVGGARREFTAIGDVVNVAARVEALTKELNEPILITSEVAAQLGPGAEMRPLAPVEIRGRVGKVSLFAVEGLRGTAPHQTLPPDGPVGTTDG